jgi:hypothetical protein
MIHHKVDKFLSLYDEYHALKETMEKLKEELETYMIEHEVKELDGYKTNRKIVLQPVHRPKVTSRYSTYDVESILPFLNKETKEKCLVQVVDKDAIEAYIQLNMLPKDIEQHKNVTSSYRLVADKQHK